MASAVIAAVKRAASPATPVFAKLSPDVTDIVSIAQACVDAGADGLSMINTLLGMVIDTDTLRPALAGVTGGLSGPGIRPVAVRCIWQVHQAMPEVPIIGMGGVRTGLDALELILAGASAVSVGTVIFHDPSAPMRILDELKLALSDRGFHRLSDAVGYAHRAPEPALPENVSAELRRCGSRRRHRHGSGARAGCASGGGARRLPVGGRGHYRARRRLFARRRRGLSWGR